MAWTHLWHCDNRRTELEILSVVVLLGNCNTQIQILEAGTEVLQEGLKNDGVFAEEKEKRKSQLHLQLTVTAPGIITSTSV